MQTFRIIKPVPALAPYVRYYWILSDDAGTVVSERTLPVGCLQLVFHKGYRLFTLKDSSLQPGSFVCGQSTGFSDVRSTGRIEMIVVVFQPYAAKDFLDIPASLFYEKNISTADMQDRDLSGLSERITDTPDHDACIGLIEQFLLRRLYMRSEYNMKRISTVLHGIDLYPEITISRLSEIACLGKKQFGRIFAEYVGTTPKEFIRIVRMQRALFVLQNDPSVGFAQLACMCGFFDQSHMIKEFKHFSGYTPTEYLSVCMPHSDYFSDF